MAQKGSGNGGNRPPAPFDWDRQRARAGVLLAEGELTDQEIAAEVGISVRQLYRWKQHPEFRKYVARRAAELGALETRFAIGRKARRLRALQGRWEDQEARREALKAVIAARAAEPELRELPGGETGLVIRRQRVLGAGENAHVVDEYEVDTALLQELRQIDKAMLEHEVQAAKELGQWVEKVAPTGPDGEEAYDDGRGFTDEEVEKLLGWVAARMGWGPATEAGQPGGVPPDGE
jgi:hypothetical protein